MVTKSGILLFLLALAWPLTVKAGVQVSVDRDPVRLDESFTITFEYSGTGAGEPDLSSLMSDFEILSNNRVSSVQINNGVAMSQQTWQVSVMARRAGILVVPPMRFGSDLSPQLKIRVLAASQAGAPGDDDIFLEASVDPDGGFVQAQLVYTVRLFRAIQTANASLSEPNLVGGDAVIRKLEKDSTYETWRDGRRFEVFERRYAVFPQASGEFTFEPIVFRGEVRDRGWRLRARRAASPAINVTIEPRPDGAADPWLPASALQLTESWPQEPPQLRAGEPVTRTLTLVAEGLTAAQLPPLVADLPDGFRGYPDQPTLNDEEGPSGLIGFRQEKLALLPTRPGQYTLPGIDLTWFDTRSGKPVVASIPDRLIDVLPALASADGSVKNGGTGMSVDESPLSSSRIADSVGQTDRALSGDATFWQAVSAALAILWIATLAAVARRRRPRRSKGSMVQQSFIREPGRALKDACDTGDAADAQRALLAWGRACWPDDPPGHLRDIARRCPGPLGEAVDAVSEALYAPYVKTWDGEALWQAIRAEERAPRKRRVDAPDGGSALGHL